MFKYVKVAVVILIISFGVSAQAKDFSVRISSDDASAVNSLIEKLAIEGKKESMRFVVDDQHPDYIMIVSWQPGGVGYKSPMARVDVYSGTNSPLFSVERKGNFTKSSAVERCAKVIIKKMAEDRR